ncbi:MAG: ABC transporter substrate-binding protein [Acidimicrobiales bacterium]
MQFRRGGPTFCVVLGITIGVLITTLYQPRRQLVRVNGGASSVAAPSGGSQDYPVGVPQPGSPAGGAVASSGSANQAGGHHDRPGTGGSLSGPTAEPGAMGNAVPLAGGTRGPSPSKVVVGVGYVDLTGVNLLGPAYDVGDPKKQWEAIIDGWHRSHVLPVNGRDIDLRFVKYSPFDASAQQAACVALHDDGVFVAIPISTFLNGIDCLTRQFHIPTISGDNADESQLAQGAPYLYTLSPSNDKLLRNVLYWAERLNVVRAGVKVGVYYENTPEVANLINTSIKVQAAKLGIPLVFYTTNNTQGGPEDLLAVQKFRSQGVSVVMPLVSIAGFTQQAKANGYRPKYIALDYGYLDNDTSTSTVPADAFDGSYGMTSFRVGEPAAGIAFSARQEACLQNYERYANTRLSRPGTGGHESAQVEYILIGCDLADALLRGLQVAGPQLSPQTFMGGLDRFADVNMDWFPSASFSPSRHGGADQQRTIQWHSDCTCWRAIGQFSPFLVP